MRRLNHSPKGFTAAVTGAVGVMLAAHLSDVLTKYTNGKSDLQTYSSCNSACHTQGLHIGANSLNYDQDSIYSTPPYTLPDVPMCLFLWYRAQGLALLSIGLLDSNTLLTTRLRL